MKSIGQMLETIHGLADTSDLTDWENGFVKSVHRKYREAGNDTTALSGKQVETIENIFNKHFA